MGKRIEMEAAEKEYLIQECLTGRMRMREAARRAADFFMERIEPLRSTDKTVLIVAHGTLNKALMLHMKKIAIRDIWKGDFQKNCCVNCYELTEDTVTVIEEAKIYYDGEATDFLEK